MYWFNFDFYFFLFLRLSVGVSKDPRLVQGLEVTAVGVAALVAVEAALSPFSESFS